MVSNKVVYRIWRIISLTTLFSFILFFLSAFFIFTRGYYLIIYEFNPIISYTELSLTASCCIYFIHSLHLRFSPSRARHIPGAFLLVGALQYLDYYLTITKGIQFEGNPIVRYLLPHYFWTIKLVTIPALCFGLWSWGQTKHYKYYDFFALATLMLMIAVILNNLVWLLL